MQAGNPHAQLQQQQHQQVQQMQWQQQRQNTLRSMHQFMTQHNLPIPYFLFHLDPAPGYNHAEFSWHWIERGPVFGSFRVTGFDMDVDAYALWTIVTKHGGSHNLSSNNTWPQLVQYLRLAPQLPQPHPVTGTTAAVDIIRKAFSDLFGPLEQLWQQRRGNNAAAGGTDPSQHGAPSPATSIPQAPTPGPAQAPTPSQSGAAASPVAYMQQEGTVDGSTLASTPAADADNKRKSEDIDEREAKKMKMDPALEPNSLPGSPERQSPQRGTTVDPERKPTPAPPPRMRNKIEYVPLKREVTSYGGRDIDAIDQELSRAHQRRPIRPIDEWATIDIEVLQLCIRARTRTELSYGLTTLQYVCAMRSATNPADPPGTQERGIQLSSAPELLEDLLDLAEETAFGPGFDGLGIGLGSRTTLPSYPATESAAAGSRPWTHRELIALVEESGGNAFASLNDVPNFADRTRDPLPRKATYILAPLAIMASLAPTLENDIIMAKHPRLLEALLRLCTLDPPCAPTKQDGPLKAPRSVSSILALKDVVDIRKHVLWILFGFGSTHVTLAHHSPEVTRMAFELLSSFLVDQDEALSPWKLLQELGGTLQSTDVHPPTLQAMALETLTQLALHDENRMAIARLVPAPRIQTLFTALVYRLPVAERDFHVLFKTAWLVWTEHIVMSLYTLAFLAPPSIKRAVRTNTRLGFGAIMLRFVRRLTVGIGQEFREPFLSVTRRAIELVKVVDDAEDVFDTPAATGGAILGFGMGYGESTVQRMEKGTGIYGGHQDAVWSVLSMGPSVLDDVMFAELDSLARLG
ncbi:hypothetical protein BKA62DRAFT_689319 [Auriculariales sp. MPI-PUGE-AT-0066]|nr:hypothetical protein BKA62DRAFT_689319 [Auriculariales sp. MPI-PUGE-AT-0066]